MEANKILGSDVLDLLFEHRNKAYGAYELRKSYNKRITTALLVTAGLFLIFFLSSFLADQFAPDEAAIEVQEVQLENLKEEPPPVEPPPPPPPKTEPPPKVEMTKFTPPEIVKDEEVKKEDIPPEVEKLEDTKIDVVSQEGVKSDIAVPPVDEGKAVVAAPVDNTNYDQTFTKVEVEASFSGDWSKYLQRNLNAEVPGENGAPAGTYPVVVQFIVDKEGNVSDVKALTSHGYGMEDEAVRAIKKGPKWTPAIQNGRQVKAYRKQPITFIVSE
ncbi:MAG: energy transducer TonB [Flaviaesturariibacter sp.]|nr:energy transducer TonB [Flaviaesturariibacter sp.]